MNKNWITHQGQKTMANDKRAGLQVGFIGLGSMGLAIARSVLKAGHQLTVYNRTRSRADELAPEGARVAESPAAASRAAEIVMTMVADDHALEQIVFAEEGVLSALPAESVHVSLSTVSPALSRRLAAAHRKKSQGYVAAPVFGRPDSAAAAKLVVAAAGPKEAIERCRPLLEVIGRKLFVLEGEAFTANIVKLGGNFMLGAMLETLSEAFALVRKAGIDPKQFLEITAGALFQSPVYENYGKIMAEGRFAPAGFKMTLGFKDVRLVLAAAEELNVPMPLAGMVHDRIMSAIARGRTEVDWSAIAELAAESAGLAKNG
jgi:3-hydroxyisobutyrate dehydrogenase-like beta-hydroxyacid dehydrogenase